MRMDLQRRTNAYHFVMYMAKRYGFDKGMKHLEKLFSNKPYVMEALIYDVWCSANGVPLPMVMPTRKKHYKHKAVQATPQGNA